MKGARVGELSVWNSGGRCTCEGRLSLSQGEQEGEGWSQGVVRMRTSNPLPCSSPLAEGERRNKDHGTDNRRVPA